MVTRRRQTKTRISPRQSLPQETEPQFAAPPVMQPKVQRKTEPKLPEWKPGGSRKSNPLERLRNSRAVQTKLATGQPNTRYQHHAERSPIVQQPSAIVQRKGGEQRKNLLMKPMAPVQQEAMQPDDRLQTRPLHNDTSHRDFTIQRTIIGSGPDRRDIWTEEIANKVAEETDHKIQDEVRRLHSITDEIRVASYDELVRNIRAGAYTNTHSNEAAEEPLGPILKFNFAGSGEQQWATHEPSVRKSDLVLDPVPHQQSGGLKYKKKKISEGRDKTVIEYAGPLGGFPTGSWDSGANSTEHNLADAKEEFNRYMAGLIAERPDEIFQINIKGFSRGAATASVFASWIKAESAYKDNVAVNLVLMDPVHGTGMYAQGHMPAEQNVSNVYEADKDGKYNEQLQTGTTVVIPVKSSYGMAAFTPQKIAGAQRLIVVYGSGAQHGSGLAEAEHTKIKNENDTIKGMKLSLLPHGVFVVNSDDMSIQQLETSEHWNDMKETIFAQASTTESRNTIIDDTIDAFFSQNSGDVMSDNGDREDGNSKNPEDVVNDLFSSDSEDETDTD